MRRVLPAVLLLGLSWAAARAADEEGEVITATDPAGNISTVYNLFDGQTHSIQVIRMNADGVTEWTQEHTNQLYEKAYAAAMDSESNLYIVGVRRQEGAKSFYLLKFDPNGYVEFELAGDASDCTALKAAVDRFDNLAVAGVCRTTDRSPVLVQKYGSDFGLLWQLEYDGGGRNYIHALQTDRDGNVLVTVETVYGDYRDGSYATRTAVYDNTGALIDLK